MQGQPLHASQEAGQCRVRRTTEGNVWKISGVSKRDAGNGSSRNNLNPPNFRRGSENSEVNFDQSEIMMAVEAAKSPRSRVETQIVIACDSQEDVERDSLVSNNRAHEE